MKHYDEPKAGKQSVLISGTIFLFLNVLLFLPGYWVNRNTNDFWPFFPQVHPRGLYGFDWISLREYILHLFFRRANADVFRISIDLCFLIGSLFLVKTLISLAGRSLSIKNKSIFVVSFCYFFLLCFEIYQAGIRLALDRSAVFIEDYALIGSGFEFLVDTSGSNNFVIFLALLLLGLCSFATIRSAFKILWIKTPLGSNLNPTLVFLLLFSAISTIFFRYFGIRRDDTTLQILAKNILFNYQRSKESLAINRNYSFQNNRHPKYHMKLDDKPNVYLFVIESYGMLLFEHQPLVTPFQNLLTEISREISEHAPNIEILSHHSTAPVFGGSSWLSTASILTGHQIDSQTRYELFKNQARSFPHLVNFFSTQGYSTFSVQAGTLGEDNTYQFQTIFSRHDMNYKGKPIGWAAVPDISSILTGENHHRRLKRPIFMHYMSVSTHTPWERPPRIPSYMHKQNTQSKLYQDTHASHMSPGIFKDYFQTLAYEWRLLKYFIKNNLDENFLVIVIGDHQPLIAREVGSSHDVPIHILSDQKRITRTFASSGFSHGMKPNKKSPAILHRDIYKILIDALFSNSTTSARE